MALLVWHSMKCNEADLVDPGHGHDAATSSLCMTIDVLQTLVLQAGVMSAFEYTIDFGQNCAVHTPA